MKKKATKIISLFLLATFSLLWITEKFAVFLENEKYSYFETTETDETESKLKTLFVNEIELFDLESFCSSNIQIINSSYSFKIKEFSFESLTPPPEIV